MRTEEDQESGKFDVMKELLTGSLKDLQKGRRRYDASDRETPVATFQDETGTEYVRMRNGQIQRRAPKRRKLPGWRRHFMNQDAASKKSQRKRAFQPALLPALP